MLHVLIKRPATVYQHHNTCLKNVSIVYNNVHMTQHNVRCYSTGIGKWYSDCDQSSGSVSRQYHLFSLYSVMDSIADHTVKACLWNEYNNLNIGPFLFVWVSCFHREDETRGQGRGELPEAPCRGARGAGRTESRGVCGEATGASEWLIQRALVPRQPQQRTGFQVGKIKACYWLKKMFI